MKAAMYTKYGPPEVVVVQETAKPVPDEKEVLIKVHASTVNRTDTGFRSAEYFISRFWTGLVRPKNQILGNEFAGIVEAVGKSVRRFSSGDKVFGFTDNRCGGHAEYMVMGENESLAHMPSNMDFHTSAALTEGSHYALCDIRAAKITKGQQVLVNGGTGAIGSAAVQILKAMGVDVTAVCHSPHVELVKSLGADEVIDLNQQDFTQLDKKFDVVFDAVGKSTFGKCKRILKPKGIYMSTELGPGAQNPFLALITPLLGGKKLLFPIPTINQADVEYLRELALSGRFKPVIDRSYTLDQIVEAHRYVQSGQKIGNVVIKIS